MKSDPGEAAERMKELIQKKAYANQDNYTAVIMEMTCGEEAAD